MIFSCKIWVLDAFFVQIFLQNAGTSGIGNSFPYSIHLKGFIYEKTSVGLVKIRKKYRFDF